MYDACLKCKGPIKESYYWHEHYGIICLACFYGAKNYDNYYPGLDD